MRCVAQFQPLDKLQFCTVAQGVTEAVTGIKELLHAVARRDEGFLSSDVDLVSSTAEQVGHVAGVNTATSQARPSAPGRKTSCATS